jgi:hypothetical protein
MGQTQSENRKLAEEEYKKIDKSIGELEKSMNELNSQINERILSDAPASIIEMSKNQQLFIKNLINRQKTERSYITKSHNNLGKCKKNDNICPQKILSDFNNVEKEINKLTTDLNQFRNNDTDMYTNLLQLQKIKTEQSIAKEKSESLAKIQEYKKQGLLNQFGRKKYYT